MRTLIKISYFKLMALLASAACVAIYALSRMDFELTDLGVIEFGRLLLLFLVAGGSFGIALAVIMPVFKKVNVLCPQKQLTELCLLGLFFEGIGALVVLFYAKACLFSGAATTFRHIGIASAFVIVMLLVFVVPILGIRRQAAPRVITSI